ncbi:MAG: glycogen/starch synthase [Chitinophagales bacterium]
MSKKQKTKVLIITQAMKPYLTSPESALAEIVRKLPQNLQENGMEIRVLMPRFGTINERRHRLHEVVRLSGINIIIDEDDFPLIIKVASLPGARMQVYFLDNEDFFRRKNIFENKDGKFHKDNTERMIFFCKGVLETVRKFGWPPDVIHCHGWMSSLIPLYIRTAYGTDPIFTDAKIVYSTYNDGFDAEMGKKFNKKALIRGVEADALTPYLGGSHNALSAGAIHYSDGIIKGDEQLDESVTALLADTDKAVLEHQSLEEDYLGTYRTFYKDLIAPEETEEEA